MSLTGVLRSMAMQPAVIIRRAPGTYERGVFVSGEETLIVTRVLLWPPSGEETARMPEAIKHKESLSIASEILLRAANTDLELLPDILEIGNKRYEVQSVDDYMLEAGLCRAIGVRV